MTTSPGIRPHDGAIEVRLLKKENTQIWRQIFCGKIALSGQGEGEIRVTPSSFLSHSEKWRETEDTSREEQKCGPNAAPSDENYSTEPQKLVLPIKAQST